MSKLYKWDKKDLRTQFFKLKDEIKMIIFLWNKH